MKINVCGFLDSVDVYHKRGLGNLIRINLDDSSLGDYFQSYVLLESTFLSLIETYSKDYGYLVGSFLDIRLEYIPNKSLRIIDINLLF